MKISTILDQVDMGAMALPEFQRGYVWNRGQVRDLMNSLYLRHPVGGLLVWVTKTEIADARGDGKLAPGSVKLILDGQQRVTSLYGIIKGEPPPFFEGNAKAFTELYFNMQDETFEFYGPVKMRGNPAWISVTELMQSGLGAFIGRINETPELQSQTVVYIDRLNRISGIRDIDLHIEEVTGEDKSVDVVVEIFNKVNSGGTKLSKGDLALAKVCAEWPDARQELRGCLAHWREHGYHFKMDWFLRNINTVLTGEARFSALDRVSAAEFEDGLVRTEKAIDHLLNVIAGRLGLDHQRVLGGVYAFPIMTRYLDQNGSRFGSAVERDKLLYWYVHTFLWGRFAGSTESILNQDLEAMEDSKGALYRLIEQLQLSRGHLKVRQEDFRGWSRGARFYPLLYLLTRVGAAQDWGTGLPLNANMLGKRSRLQIHHIFPKSLLYEHGYDKTQVNALANYCFLTQSTNLNISNKDPLTYLTEVEEKYPGALASQWMPMDRDLWSLDRYLDFVEARRELLAQAANEFLDSLLAGSVPESAEPETETISPSVDLTPGGIIDEDEEEALLAINIWVTEQHLPEGELLYELVNDQNELIALLDLAWPDGLQEGLTEPVTLLIDEPKETVEAASQSGFRCFTDVNDFRQYVLSEILALEPAYG